ncbi:hypothetical protein [Candidatus Symbiopectobacterium sp. NZEC135]|uniref:hypothetical protein n=1 Tax=Candidatus Symbiopectobacterium sp. NZEC135 TaxID=2820471 RepID=UPI002225E50C|nr:hypothetical protein [Candidatus Symbiopectobacterium sp. NZEC135]MCW2479729.1 hypothetical protein [Candidatus Symbiopectobacterium sp. NZEC135]
MGVFDVLGSQRENFLKWIAGHRSERLMAEGRENNFTADEIAYMQTLDWPDVRHDAGAFRAYVGRRGYAG